jgi:hypothetical protein
LATPAQIKKIKTKLNGPGFNTRVLKCAIFIKSDWQYSEDVKKAAIDAARLLNIAVTQVPNAPNFWKMDRRPAKMKEFSVPLSTPKSQ